MRYFFWRSISKQRRPTDSYLNSVERRLPAEHGRESGGKGQRKTRYTAESTHEAAWLSLLPSLPHAVHTMNWSWAAKPSGNRVTQATCGTDMRYKNRSSVALENGESWAMHHADSFL